MKTHTVKLTILTSCVVVFTVIGCDKIKQEEKVAVGEGKEVLSEVQVEAKEELSKAESFYKKKLDRKKVNDSEISKAAKETITKSFPAAEEIVWETYPEIFAEVNNDSVEIFEMITPEFYVVTFKNNNIVQSAKLNKEGKLIESKKSGNNIPQAVEAGLQNSVYKDWTIISEKEEIKGVEEKEPVFRIVVQKNKNKHILYFKKTGELMRILAPVQ